MVANSVIFRTGLGIWRGIFHPAMLLSMRLAFFNGFEVWERVKNNVDFGSNFILPDSL